VRHEELVGLSSGETVVFVSMPSVGMMATRPLIIVYIKMALLTVHPSFVEGLKMQLLYKFCGAGK